MSKHIADGNKVILAFAESPEDNRLRAICDDAQRAADMLNRAAYLNDAKRRYTAAARLIADVETLPGFAWIE